MPVKNFKKNVNKKPDFRKPPMLNKKEPKKQALQVLQEFIALAKSTIQTLYSAAGIKVEEAL